MISFKEVAFTLDKPLRSRIFVSNLFYDDGPNHC